MKTLKVHFFEKMPKFDNILYNDFYKNFANSFIKSSDGQTIHVNEDRTITKVSDQIFGQVHKIYSRYTTLAGTCWIVVMVLAAVCAGFYAGFFI